MRKILNTKLRLEKTEGVTILLAVLDLCPVVRCHFSVYDILVKNWFLY